MYAVIIHIETVHMEEKRRLSGIYLNAYYLTNGWISRIRNVSNANRPARKRGIIMRVISQNERLDLPYENIVVEIMDSVIVAYTPMTNPLRMAQYKSQEKAEKAMQMLHNCYQGALPNTIFRFPQEDEI